MERLTPTVEQESAIKKMIAESKQTSAALNASTMGAGKTLIGVEVAKRLNAEVILLIAPLGTRVGWKATFERQGVELPFQWINSTKAGKVAMDNWQWQLPGIYFVGTELFVRKAFEGRARSKTWSAKYPDMVMFDEAHRGQNRDSKTYKALKAVSGKFKMSMSGTPAGNKFEGAWAVTKWLWPDLIENSYHAWVERWCATEYDHFAPGNRRVVGEKNPGDFFAALPCYIRLESELNVGYEYQQFYVELSPKQRKAYNQLEKDMITWVEGNPLVVEFPITLRARLRQATLGMFSVDGAGDVSFDNDCESAKIDAMLYILDEEFDGEPSLILTDSRKFADVVVHRINTSKLGNASAWHGNVSQGDREERKKQFVDGSLDYLVAVTSAIAEGVDGLQYGTRNILWLSRSDNRILNEQATARILRHGQDKTVRSYELVAVDTYDSGVLSSQVQQAIKMNKTLKARGK